MKKVILVICSIMMCVALASCASKEKEIEIYRNSDGDVSVYETNNVHKYIDFLEDTPEDQIIDISITEEDGVITYHVTFKR